MTTPLKKIVIVGGGVAGLSAAVEASKSGQNILLIFVAIGMVSWLDMARIVRGQTLSLKRKEFIEAAQVGGVSTSGIVIRHIVPNLSLASWGWVRKSR